MGMGERVNPHKLRVGFETNWESKWYYDEDDSKNAKDFIIKEPDSHRNSKTCSE